MGKRARTDPMGAARMCQEALDYQTVVHESSVPVILAAPLEIDEYGKQVERPRDGNPNVR